MKNTYDLSRNILNDPLLSSTEKLVGLAIAHHINRKTLKTRLNMEKLAVQCAVSSRTVIRAITKLVERGYYERKRTGRSPILSVSSSTILSNVDVTPMTHACDTSDTSKQKKPYGIDDGIMPWAYDCVNSTIFEERGKREEIQFENMIADSNS